MEFTHSKFGKCELVELTQKQMENYNTDMMGKSDLALAVYRGDQVRSAIKHGFLIEPVWVVEDVDNAKPGHIIWLSDCITKVLVEALNIDPLS